MLTPEITCESSGRFFAKVEYGPYKRTITGVSAMMYSWMVKVFGKEEASREFYEMMMGNKNGANSPVAPLQDPAMDRSLI